MTYPFIHGCIQQRHIVSHIVDDSSTAPGQMAIKTLGDTPCQSDARFLTDARSMGAVAVRTDIGGLDVATTVAASGPAGRRAAKRAMGLRDTEIDCRALPTVAFLTKLDPARP